MVGERARGVEGALEDGEAGVVEVEDDVDEAFEVRFIMRAKRGCK